MGMAPTVVKPERKCGDPHPQYPHLEFCRKLGGWASKDCFNGSLRYAIHSEGDTSGNYYDLGPFLCAAHVNQQELTK